MVVDVILLVVGAAVPAGGLITGNLFCRLLRRYCWILAGGRPSLLLELLGGATVSMIYAWASDTSFLSDFMFVFSTVTEVRCKPVNLPSADPPLDDSILELPLNVSSPPVITVESAPAPPPPTPVTTVSLPWLLIPPELTRKLEGVGAFCIGPVVSGSDYFSLLFLRKSNVV